MSGTSYDSDCPKCEGKNTLMCSSDYKPYDAVDGFCLKCGFCYYTMEGQITEEDLKEQREAFEYKEE